MSNKIYGYKNLEMDFKDVNVSKREVVFQFAAYGNIDSYGDVSTKGMFNRSVKNNFKRIKHLLDHDGSKAIGVPQEIWDDNDGAYMRSKIGTHWEGDDFMKKAESGIITESSYGFATVAEEPGTIEGKSVNILKEVKLWEASSLQTWGANEFTPLISLAKSCGGIDYITKAIKRMDALEKFCKNTTASDETIELLLIEIKQLQSLVAEMLSTDSTKDVTPPDEAATKMQEQEELLTAIKLLSIKLD